MSMRRAVCALVLVLAWLSQSGIMTCERPRPGHPACPMHGATGSGAAVSVAPATGAACHDSSAASHCVPGQACSVHLAAIFVEPVTLATGPSERHAPSLSTDYWLSCDAGRAGPPPRPSNRSV